MFFHDYLEMEKKRASAESRRWLREAEDERKILEIVKAEKKSIEELKEKDPEMARYHAIRMVEKYGLQPPTGRVKYCEDASISYGEQARRLEEKQKNMATIKEFALKKSAQNIARLAEYAYDVEKQRRLKKPLWIAPENVFAETYGSHPQELKELILKSREEMAKRLMRRGLSEDEAKEIAEKHIKATFDIGHANTWRKYFKAKPGETIAETDRRFKKWLINQVKDLIKNKIIGHVHLADNFGYFDEHLTPGQGNAPIEEFIKELKKAGFKEPMVVEPGAQGEGETIYSALTGMWKLSASPVYRMAGKTQSWTDIEGSYFGRTASPYSIVGRYVPSQEWTFWSETQIE